MTKYVFIESRDPFESRDVQFVVETATALKQNGGDVTIFLVQNGVLAARLGARISQLPMLAEEGIRMLADDFSICERGIRAEELMSGINESGIDTLVEMLAQPDTRVIWH